MTEPSHSPQRERHAPAHPSTAKGIYREAGTTAAPEPGRGSIANGKARHYTRRLAFVLLVIVVCAIVLRVATIGRESLDGDEMFTLRIALLPIGAALQGILHDLVHPPLNYLLVKLGITLWGASPLGIRFWSLLFGVATVPLVAVLGMRLPRARYTGLLAAAIVAANQPLVYYSQQARSYSLYTFLLVLFALWLSAIASEPTGTRLWVAGCVLMALLVYTNYVAEIYILSAVFVIALCQVPKRTKVRLLTVTAIAAVSFIPWMVAEFPVYLAKHGVGGTLTWEGQPSFYMLRRVWASSLGILNVRGTTTLTLLLVCVLVFVALWRGRPLRRSPLLAAVTSMAVVPVLVMYVLSVLPINLPIFGLRQFLPSLVFTALLCCYGLERLALRSALRSRVVFAVGCSVLIALASVPTLSALAHAPSRIPYQRVAKDIQSHPGFKGRLYTTWFYGIGEPVNYYCRSECVQPLPSKFSELPDSIVLLYRPEAKKEVAAYRELEKAGFRPQPARAYFTAQGSSWGTMMIRMIRLGDSGRRMRNQ